MYRTFDEINGFPPRLYRNPEEIKRDIRVVKERMEQINDMLNIRELLSEAFEGADEQSLPRRAEQIRELLKYADDTLQELSELSKTLDELRAELSEVRELVC